MSFLSADLLLERLLDILDGSELSVMTFEINPSEEEKFVLLDIKSVKVSLNTLNKIKISFTDPFLLLKTNDQELKIWNWRTNGGIRISLDASVSSGFSNMSSRHVLISLSLIVYDYFECPVPP